LTARRFGESHDVLRQAIDNGVPGCRFEIAKRLTAAYAPSRFDKADALTKLSEMDDGKDPLAWVKQMRWVPGVDEMLGLLLYAMAKPAPFRRYAEQDAKDAAATQPPPVATEPATP
jgi:hypothetical protein